MHLFGSGLGLGQIVVCSHARDANVVAYPAFQSGRPLYGAVSFPPAPAGQDGGPVYRFAFDESGGTGRGYDRLYFDLNHDGDLTNDKPLASPRDPTGRTGGRFPNAEIIDFAMVAIPFPFGPQDWRPMEILPRLMVFHDGPKLLHFIATKARQGVIRLGNHSYSVCLSHGSTIAGWFDHPQTSLSLAPMRDNAP